MGMVLVDETSSAMQKLLEIREKCTLSVKSGLILEYDKTRKVIVSAETTTEKAEVFVIIENRPGMLKVIVPFFTAREICHVTIIPRCKIPVPFVFKATLREYQEKDSIKIINQMERISCCYFQAYPGYGKTVMMAFMIAYFKLRAIIVVPSLTLVEQTFTAMKSYLPDANVFIMGTDRVIPEGVDIVICYRGRLNGSSAALMAFEFLILDEVHLLSTHIGIAGMLTCRPTKVLALTATPGERNNITERFVGACEIESLSDKTWYICFPRIYSGLNSANYKGVNGYTEAISALSESQLYIQSTINMVFYFRRMNQRVILITMRKDLRDR
jgi:Type III restriction enzyme, res subunit